MAVVYRAVQEPLGRTVAIKALKPSIAIDSSFAKRFEREALFMASLQHENILHVYDFIKIPELTGIVMEYVQGIDLYDLLELRPKLPVDIAAIVALQVARALDYAHFRGIVHRDIKPANIMISFEGAVKLMDFGIARDDKLSDLTETGTGLGTPSYMSPEQILGDKIDFRSDLFSVGIVLYQMVAGKKPFVEDEVRTVMQKIRMDRHVSPRRQNAEVPRALERIIGRCLEKLPSNRYPSTQGLIDELADFLTTRVTMNHNARLVSFLRDLKVISEEKADSILASSVLSRPKRHLDPDLVRHSGLVHVGVMFSMLALGVTVQGLTGGLSQLLPQQGNMANSQPGHLRFLAEPWAEVWIDGVLRTTTPNAERFEVPAGTHYVQFRNPYFLTAEREVIVRPGDDTLVRVTLSERP